MGSAALLLDGREVGRLIYSLAGGKADIRASCPFENGYIYRVSLLRGGNALALGVMQPEGGQFVLRKKLPAAEKWFSGPGTLPVATISRSKPGETAPPPPAEGRKPGGAEEFVPLEGTDFIKDLYLLQLCNSKADKLYTHCNDRRLLAFPVEPGGPSDFLPLFSAAEVKQMNGRLFGVIKLDENGLICH